MLACRRMRVITPRASACEDAISRPSIEYWPFSKARPSRYGNEVSPMVLAALRTWVRARATADWARARALDHALTLGLGLGLTGSGSGSLSTVIAHGVIGTDASGGNE